MYHVPFLQNIFSHLVLCITQKFHFGDFKWIRELREGKLKCTQGPSDRHVTKACCLGIFSALTLRHKQPLISKCIL